MLRAPLGAFAGQLAVAAVLSVIILWRERAKRQDTLRDDEPRYPHPRPAVARARFDSIINLDCGLNSACAGIAPKASAAPQYTRGLSSAYLRVEAHPRWLQASLAVSCPP